MSENWIIFFAGLLGAGIGAGAVVFTTLRQIKSTTVSANRQDWINTLRNEISKFISSVHVVSFGLLEEVGFTPLDSKEKLADVFLIEAKIRLMLNPLEEDHQRLVETMHDCMFKASQAPLDDSDSKETKSMEVRNSTEELVSISQNVLKREWVRVKTGK